MAVSTTRYRLKLFLLSLVMLVVAMAFTAGLNGASFRKVYTELLTRQVYVIGLDGQVRLERAIGLGKLLDKFVGLDVLLDQLRGELPLIDELYVLSASGSLIKSSTEASVLEPGTYRAAAEFLVAGEKTTRHEKAAGDIRTFRSGSDHHLLFGLRDRKGTLTGVLGLRFSDTAIVGKVGQVLRDQLNVLSQVVLLCSGLIGLGLLLYGRGGSAALPGITGHERKNGTGVDRKLYFFILLVVVGAQVYFSIHSTGLFREAIERAALEQVTTQTSLIKKELESRVLSRGISIDRLRGIEKRFGSIITANRAIDTMQLIAPDGRVLNMADRKGVVQPSPPGNLSVVSTAVQPAVALLPLYGKKDRQHPVGYLRATLSRDNITSRVRGVYLDSFTVVALSILFLLEMKFLLDYFLRPRNRQDPKHEGMPGWSFARPAAFLLLLGWALPVSFIPLKMQLLYQPFLGLSKELVLGLPISVEMGGALVTALLAGSLTDRFGWHLPFLLGILLVSSGSFFSGLADTVPGFIGSRGVVGLGYGLSWMGIQGFVFYNTSASNRALGYSTLVAGIFSGHICGTAVGAMLAERFGYDPVFYAGAFLLPLTGVFALIFMSRFMKRPENVAGTETLKLGDLYALLTDLKFSGVMLFSVVPFSLCQVGLLYYAAPIYLKELGVTQSSIGRVLMVYGVSVIFIAPLVSRLVDRSNRKGVYIFLGGCVGGAGLVSLYFFSGLIPVMVAVFSLGLSSCLAGAAQPAIALNLETAQKVGTGRSMAIQRAADKLGQMAGPLFLGMLVTSIGIENSIGVAGLTFLVCTLIFVLLVRESSGGKAKR